MLLKLLTETEEVQEGFNPGVYIPLIILVALFALLFAVYMIAKKKKEGPIPSKLILTMPKTTKMVIGVFVLIWLIGTILCWFLLPSDMEFRLLTQIVLTCFLVLFLILYPMSIRQRLMVEGDEILYRPMIGKERIYRFSDIKIVVIRPAGFEGNAYKYYSKDGKKLFSFTSTTPYNDNFFELVELKSKKLQIVDNRPNTGEPR